ncbi:hypothetical protein DYB32_010304 [Aphanomyces invadans]|uniref:Tc1-like transposase DDE domain-containing protein n=1 Tax=Aphanomyces invadans TaxID=157072 RepID=A0A418AGD6_9STRA|nr:hypothetical protein DYB32_010304 [Aphanomyces invadans]
MKSAVRAVQRFLKRNGYRRGRRPGSSTYHLSQPNALARDTYVKLMQPLVHRKKENHKGHRYCFIAGILESPGLDCRVVALDIFRGGKSTAKQPKDYHAMFNHDCFVNWFAKLFAELDGLGVVNACIVMDNAKYHKGRPSGTPTSRLCKKSLQAACTRYGLSFEPSDFKSILWEKLSVHIEKHIKPQVVQMAIDKGHQVVFTPPHHSDLQPIELVWANVKGHVGRRYTDATGLSDAKE